MKTIRLAITVSLPALLLACPSIEHTHEPAPGGRGHHEEHGHGHGESAEAVTRWSEHTELFVEYPALVVGQGSAFAAHLTRLSDFSPVHAGSVVVVLSGGGAPEERFEVDAPSVPGIFRPVARPEQAGRRRLTLRLESEASQGDLYVTLVLRLPDPARDPEAARSAAEGLEKLYEGDVRSGMKV